MGKKVKITNERFEEIMREARVARYLRMDEQYRDEVPEHIDRAADRAFRQMEAWIAAGVILSPAPEAPPLPKAAGTATKAAGAAAALKATAVTLSAALLISAGGYLASPTLRQTVNGVLGIEAASPDTRRSARAPADYVIPSPGEGYELREDLSTETVAAKWFVAERRLLMVQIAKELPEEPTGVGEVVTVGDMVGMAYEIDGDQQLLLRDGELSILIKMYNADRQELLDYAEQFALANAP